MHDHRQGFGKTERTSKIEEARCHGMQVAHKPGDAKTEKCSQQEQAEDTRTGRRLEQRRVLRDDR